MQATLPRPPRVRLPYVCVGNVGQVNNKHVRFIRCRRRVGVAAKAYQSAAPAVALLCKLVAGGQKDMKKRVEKFNMAFFESAQQAGYTL